MSKIVSTRTAVTLDSYANEETLICVNNIGKKFCRDLKKSLWYGVKDIAREVIPSRHEMDRRATLRAKEFWAVNDISFELRRGECLGLIGHNGAGKTTLLKMLCGLIKLDKGRIEMRGRVGALIALGAGFNPILTGRENIYVNGSILGFSKSEIDAMYDDIVEFAELEEFMEMPVRSYSSGMKIRLGFSIASSLKPDILLLDEVLAVGDAAFRDKCYHRIAEVRRQAAVIFVSHSMEQIARTCTSVMTMKHGEALYLGDVETAIRQYEDTVPKNASGDKDGFLSLYPPITSFAADLTQLKINSGDPFEAYLTFESESAINECAVKVLFYNAKGAFAADGYISLKELGISLQKGTNRVKVTIDSLPLKNGSYKVAFNLIDEIGDMVVWSYKMHEIKVSGAYIGGIADCQLRICVDQ